PSCTGGGACTPPNACHVGQITCSEGVETCTDTQQPQSNGTACGTNKVCSNGSCASCAAGGACALSNQPCLMGAISCATGTPVCASAGEQPNGTSCGAGMVCFSGLCGPCQDGGSCVPSNACHQGTLVCSTGTPVCND